MFIRHIQALLNKNHGQILKKKYCPRPKNQEEVKLAILEAFFAVKIHDFQYYHEYISFNDPTMIHIYDFIDVMLIFIAFKIPFSVIFTCK